MSMLSQTPEVVETGVAETKVIETEDAKAEIYQTSDGYRMFVMHLNTKPDTEVAETE